VIRQDTKEMIGQMIMIGFREAGLTATSPIIRSLKEFSLGGVILYNIRLKDYLEAKKKNPDLTREEAARLCPKNIISPDQLKRLTASLQKASRIPPLIAVDMEGGQVSRLGPAAGFPEAPTPRFLGKKDDLSATTQAASIIAGNLKRTGINLNLAPVVDLSLNPEGLIARNGRSFGALPDLVTRHARAFIQAHRQLGILTTLKHFPGKGSTGEDTHFEMADVTSLYQEQELFPFRQLIQEGRADLVMTAHIHHRGWDPDFPVTLSPIILKDLLRGKLGYAGVIISDDLLMEAIIRQFSLEEACLLAVQAGVDILLASNNSPQGDDPDLFRRMFEALWHGFEQGRISAEMIQAAGTRIMSLKRRLSI
jgi:beta-N-acetylhexosaminidase